MSAKAITCPSCLQAFRVLSDQAGRTVKCPHCQAKTKVPDVIARESNPARVQGEMQVAAAPTFSEGTLPRKRAFQKLGWSGGLRYSHSSFAEGLGRVSAAIMLIALVTQLYILVVTEWSQITSLPFSLAVPSIALLFIPAAILCVTGLALMASSHCVEYLARLARQ